MVQEAPSGRSIRIALLASGERFPLLVNGLFGLPDPFATEFVLTSLRTEKRAVSTICAYLAAIGAGLDYLDEKGICLEERLASSSYLTTQELTAFASVCSQGRTRSGSFSKQAPRRYSYFLAFVQWRARSFLSRSSSDVALARAEKALKQFERRADAVAPPEDRSLPSPDARGGLTSEQRELFLAVISPDDDRNPWKSLALRYRNFAMLSLAYELGPRAGDVLSLKVRDLNLRHRPATVTFHRRHDDPEDTRTYQPVLKTKPRVLMISDSLARTLETWIDKHRSDRSEFPDARKHPFLFVNSSGAPLGQRGYQLIYQVLRQEISGLGRLTSHVLRYDWNERWVELGADESSNSESIKREQCYAMGWSERSEMPAKYARRAIAASANKRIARMHANAERRAATRSGKSPARSSEE